MRFSISAFIFAAMLGGAAHSGEQNTVVVFDASGSMWGQIDGKTKIEIARDAFAEAQSVWDGEARNLGLIAYGHRRKGDCSDIEVIVPLEGGSAKSVSERIQSLSPKGKTPLSQSVRLAAEELRYREEAATVVLFSDGIETCDADPCALANELERDGIDFTAHVIGFGLAQDTDRAQLECIADNTGGQYFDAENADALQDALRQVAEVKPVEPAPEPETGLVALRLLLDHQEGTVRPTEITYQATQSETGDVQHLGSSTDTAEIVNGLQAELPEGSWKIEAISPEGRGEIEVEITPETKRIRVPFEANETGFKLWANGPYRPGVSFSAYLGVTASLQNNAQYVVAMFPAGATDYDQRMDFSYRLGSDSTGYTEHTFDAPGEPGEYEIVVIRGYDLSEADARFPITIAENAPIKWVGETSGEPGQEIEVRISGDAYRNNTLTLRDGNGQDVIRQWVQGYFRNDNNEEINGSVFKLETGPTMRLPDEPGEYELFYKATSEEQEISLGKIMVGNVILEDDPDAVEPPANIEQPEQESEADTQSEPAEPDSDEAGMKRGYWELREVEETLAIMGILNSAEGITQAPHSTNDTALGKAEDIALVNLIPKGEVLVLSLRAGDQSVNAVLLPQNDGTYRGNLVVPTSGVVLVVELVHQRESAAELTEETEEVTDLEQSLLTGAEAQGHETIPDEHRDAIVAYCLQGGCKYDSPEPSLKGIPIARGYALLEPIYWKTGELHISWLNPKTGVWVSLNPRQITDLWTCVEVGTQGWHTTNPQTDTGNLCATVDGLDNEEIGVLVSFQEDISFWLAEYKPQ